MSEYPRKIGIIGGLSPESTLYYYRKFIDLSRDMLLSNHYPTIVIYSLDFGKFSSADWDQRKEMLLEAAKSLEKCGVEVMGIAANTPHKVFPWLMERVQAEMISIVESVAQEAVHRGLKKLLLTGTKITMEDGFYENVLRRYGLEVIVPEDDERNEIERIIREELTFQNLRSREKLRKMIESYKEKVDGVVLGCTELPLAIKEGDVPISVLDSAAIHVKSLLLAAISRH